MSSKVINFTLSKELKHTELGKTLVKKQLFSEAFDHFKTAIKENKNQGIEILIFLYKIKTKDDIAPLKLLTIAKVYLELHFAQEAFDVIEELLEEWPTNEATYDLLAKLATKKQLTKKVKLIFENAINNNIFFYPSIISILPTIYLDEKNYSNAITLYETLIEEFPNEYHYYKVLSELYFRKRDYESASEILSKLISLAPFKSEELIQPTEQILRKIPRHSSVRKLFANILFRAFKPEEACQQISILLNYHPHQKETAIGILKEQNESFPNHPDILHLIADLLIETQSYTESLGYIESLLEASPLQSDKALVLMNKIIQVFPNHCLALEIIGNIYFQQENFIQALHYYNQCVDHLEEANDVNFLDNLKEIQSNPESTSQNKASLIIAKILTKSQQKEEALSVISTLANTDVDIDANLLKISLLNQFKDFNQSQDLLSDLVKKQPFQWNIHIAQKTHFMNT